MITKEQQKQFEQSLRKEGFEPTIKKSALGITIFASKGDYYIEDLMTWDTLEEYKDDWLGNIKLYAQTISKSHKGLPT